MRRSRRGYRRIKISQKVTGEPPPCTTVEALIPLGADETGLGPVGPAGTSEAFSAPHTAGGPEAGRTIDLEMSGAELVAEHRGWPVVEIWPERCPGSDVLTDVGDGTSVVCAGCGELVEVYTDCGNWRKRPHNRPEVAR